MLTLPEQLEVKAIWLHGLKNESGMAMEPVSLDSHEVGELVKLLRQAKTGLTKPKQARREAKAQALIVNAISLVQELFGVHTDVLLSSFGDRSVKRARSVAMYVLRVNHNTSFADMAQGLRISIPTCSSGVLSVKGLMNKPGKIIAIGTAHMSLVAAVAEFGARLERDKV